MHTDFAAALAVGEAVKVYWNLHKRCFSVQTQDRLRAHVDDLTLSDVTFRVNQAGRQRVLVARRKNVHAKVHGLFSRQSVSTRQAVHLRYDPYVSGFFHCEDDPEKSVIAADYCRLHVVAGFVRIAAINPLFQLQAPDA